MENRFLIVTFLSILSICSFGQQNWSGVGTVEGSNIAANAIAHDSWNNTYVCGNVYNTAFFGDTTLLVSDVFAIAKYDMNDSLIWARSYGTLNSNHIYDLECDDMGFIYIITGGSIEVSPGNYEDNPMVLKLDPYGNIIWYQFMQVANGALLGLELDENNNIYVGFSYQNTGLFAGVELVAVSAGSDAAVGKLDSDGNFQWVKGYECLVSFGIGTYDIFYKEGAGLVSGLII